MRAMCLAVVWVIVTIATVSGKPYTYWPDDTLDDRHDVNLHITESAVMSDSHVELDDVKYVLNVCSGSTCSCCFQVWKLQACITFTSTADGALVQLSLFGKQVYQGHVIMPSSNGSKTISVPIETLPYFVQKVLAGNILIKLSWLTSTGRRVCFVFEAKVKNVGTVTWPESTPRCFLL